ncbi:hypothetical protein GGU10DRAFT_402652 [Lentinula aff. detonsa]|uniref:PinX1-related protein 1 n=1 Tax=Lentinula aff. detonsa TaxID=2804958 RepID=A0AA38NR53_9AGAR|nr:hypothetical protein GGU10DRAFT_402652 [Lentinula aff. detonsa]
MGLAGRKVKQRIGHDPRNLTWADDASKFGANYLAKFGWDSSKGLGVEGQGRTSHIKVSQKLDMLGIGAAQSKDPNGIAWRQNKDFENLLKRLNENAPASAAQTDTRNAEDGDEGVNSDVDMEKDDKKESKDDRKKRKKEEKQAKKEKKEKKKRKRDEGDDEETEQMKAKKKAKAESATIERAPQIEKVEEPPKRVIPRHRAHRARAIAAKNISSKSAVHISEILGIASSSSSTTPTVAATPSGTLTPLDQDVVGLEKLTTSTKSVSDYFKERLLAKSSGKASPLSSMVTQKTVGHGGDGSEDEDEDAPRAGLGSFRNSTRDEDDLNDADRGGLGSTRTTTTLSSTASTIQMGMSKFKSMFTSATITTQEEVAVKPGPSAGGNANDMENVVENAETREEQKKRRKEGKKKEKKRNNDVEEAVGDSETVHVQDEVAEKKGKDELRREKAEKKEKKRRKREERSLI